MEFYSGFNGGFRQPDLTRPGGWQSTFFGNEQLATDEPNVPCGRVVHDACVVLRTPKAPWSSGSTPLSSSTRHPTAATAIRSFTVILDPSLPLGPYYAMSLADGPTMSMRIDLVAPDQPVQAASEVRAAAERQYEDDLAWLAGLDRVSSPAEASNPDGTKTWQVAAGLSGPEQTVAVGQ